MKFFLTEIEQELSPQVFQEMYMELGVATLFVQNKSSISSCVCFVSVRWGGAELHNIAACIGGAASQESLKVIVEQYVPLNNTFLFDGVFAKAAVYEL